MTQVPEFLVAILASIYGRLNKKNITVKNYRNKKKVWNGCQWDTCSYNHFHNIRWPYVKSPSFLSNSFCLNISYFRTLLFHLLEGSTQSCRSNAKYYVRFKSLIRVLKMILFIIFIIHFHYTLQKNRNVSEYNKSSILKVFSPH